MHARKLIVTTILTLAFASTFSLAKSGDANSLWKIQKTLTSKKYVDLTHEFEPGIPRWPGFPDETRKTIYWYDKRPNMMGAGFFSELFTHVGDPPAHFIKGLRTLDQIDPKEMILPLVVVDYRHGSRYRHGQGGLLTRDVHPEHEPLPDRAAHESRSSSRSGRNCGGQFSKT